MKFTDFNLSTELLAGIEVLGFETPTEIQEKSIPFLIENRTRDLIGLAQTGTGKTAAFGLPLIECVDRESDKPLGLILTPTRELCLQVTEEIKRFSAKIPEIRVTPVYGGANIVDQLRALRRGSQIVVATPGRLVDLIRRNGIDISRITDLILDEADIMLNMGFKEELDAILEETPDDKRVVLFSATMPPEVARIASTYMTDPAEISVGKKNTSSSNITHSYCMVQSRDKYFALKRLLDFHPGNYSIIFCRTKIGAKQTADNLIKDGYNAESLHGDLSQTQRDLVMRKFREKTIKILVATDVAARGLDVDSLSHVVHFDLPDDPENYIHRSGRTGRAGRQGASIAITNMREKFKIRSIENKMGGKIERIMVPQGPEVCERQLFHLIDRVHTVQVDQERIEPFMAVIEEKLASLDREALLKHFVSLEFNQFLEYYKDAEDINPKPMRERERGRYGDRDSFDRGRRNGPSRGRGGDFEQVWINLGRKDHVLPPQLIGLINDSTNRRNIDLGKIYIDGGWSTVQVDKRFSRLVMDSLNGYDFNGKIVTAKPDRGAPRPGGRGDWKGNRQPRRKPRYQD